MKQFSIIHVPLYSFFSGELYRDVGLNWKGVGFGYLFLLLAVCTIPRILMFQRGLSNFIDREVPKFVEQVPKITIEKGEVYIDQPQPYFIKAPDSNDIIAIIDTTGQIPSLENSKAFVLLTKTKVVYRQSKFETRTVDLSQVQHFELDRDKIMGWLNTLKKLSVPIAYPFVLLGSFIFRIIQALIYAAIGLIFAAWYKTKLSYPAMLRLAVVAVSPCIILRTIFEYASVNIPAAGLWFFLIAIGYLFLGVKICSQVEEPPLQQGNIFPDSMQ